jgi:diguanylate cyclase (GGDEF)-like protein
MLLVPLRTGSGSEGVLKVLSTRPHAFDGHDVETLQLMAGEIAAAMRTGTEFAAKQSLLGERTRIAEELASANTALQHQALHDALTGLPNRVLLHDRVEQAMRTARRDNTSMALFLMDLNGFKEVNDTLGHEAGDMLLQEVARRLRGALRASDTVARLGGDEFAVVLPEVDAERAAAMAEKLQSVLTEPPIVAERRVSIGVSIGIALYPAHGDSATVLLRCADAAMYAAKRGRCPYCVYHPEYDLIPQPRLARV